jgi:peroxiredoxin family protein
MIEKLAAIVTTGDPARLAELVATCQEAADVGNDVRVFFRDESIPVLCRAEVRERLGLAEVEDDLNVEALLNALAGDPHVELYACSSSLYVWGVTGADLIPAVTGARGLIAFLADDLDGSTRVLSY